MRAVHVGRVALIAASAWLAACPGTDNGVGSSCANLADCDPGLQCLDHICQHKCHRAPDCGDGYSCTTDGFCVLATNQAGETCASEVECAPGLACVLDIDDGGDGIFDASCAGDHDGHAFGAACERDEECRNGTCALGRCVDLCANDRDCADAHVCTTVPRIDDLAQPDPINVGTFKGCLPMGGTIEWSIPIAATQAEVFLPVPGNARGVLAVMSVDDESQYVGASRLLEPDNELRYELDDEVFDPFDPRNDVRHTPTLGSSVMMIPSRPDHPIEPGAYRLALSSYRLIQTGPEPPHLVPGTATPRLKAIAKLGDGAVLDLHFYFLDLSDHPCAAQLGGTLNAAAAGASNSAFQDEFVLHLRTIFARASIPLGAITYDDLIAKPEPEPDPGHPDLDGLDSTMLPDLLSLSTRPGGVSVFLVRTITPVGLQALVGSDRNPGDPTPGSRIGGVAVSVDTLCYRSWLHLARVTAHAIARHMGLFRNVEPEPFSVLEDPILDSPGMADPMEDMVDNLMYFSEFGGEELSNGQKEILRRSGVLR
jgi:hypothetical protein